MFTYTPDKDIPDLTGKVFLTTGGTSGIGRESILQLAKHNPKHIYFTGRNTQAADAVITEAKSSSPNVTFIPCDQTSLYSVSEAAKSFLQKSGNELDVLICNASIMAIPPGVSKDRYEIQFAINHLAHSLLIKLCISALQKTATEKGDARIVSVTSLAFRETAAAGIVFKDLKSNMANLSFRAKWMLYAQSKLANVLYASQISKNYPNLTITAIHPGVIPTGLAGHLTIFDRIIVKVATLNYSQITLQEGAYNTLWAATSDTRRPQSRVVYEPVGKAVSPTKLSSDTALEEKLWEWTEKELLTYS